MYSTLNNYMYKSSFRSSPLCQVPPGRDREGTGVSQKNW